MLKPAKFLATSQINGRPVSFFTPPHDEPDFLWVDVQELTKAFMDDEAAARMVQHAQAFDPDNRAVATAVNGDRIATIVCHAMAQGLCGAIDLWNGAVLDEDEHGPAHSEYSFALATTANQYAPLDFHEIIAAYKNVGGPFMRSMREGPDEPTAA